MTIRQFMEQKEKNQSLDRQIKEKTLKIKAFQGLPPVGPVHRHRATRCCNFCRTSSRRVSSYGPRGRDRWSCSRFESASWVEWPRVWYEVGTMDAIKVCYIWVQRVKINSTVLEGQQPCVPRWLCRISTKRCFLRHEEPTPWFTVHRTLLLGRGSAYPLQQAMHMEDMSALAPNCAHQAR